VVHGQLAWNAGPATRILSGLSGSPVTFTAGPCAVRGLRAQEAAALDADPLDRCCERPGTMTAAGITVARTKLLVLADRCPPGAWKAIYSGQLAEEALGPYGLAWDRREFTSEPGSAAVSATSVLRIGDVPAALAGENVPAAFCDHLAAMASAVPGSV
jgi:hypothetical protein